MTNESRLLAAIADRRWREAHDILQLMEYEARPIEGWTPPETPRSDAYKCSVCDVATPTIYFLDSTAYCAEHLPPRPAGAPHHVGVHPSDPEHGAKLKAALAKLTPEERKLINPRMV